MLFLAGTVLVVSCFCLVVMWRALSPAAQRRGRGSPTPRSRGAAPVSAPRAGRAALVSPASDDDDSDSWSGTYAPMGVGSWGGSHDDRSAPSECSSGPDGPPEPCDVSGSHDPSGSCDTSGSYEPSGSCDSSGSHDSFSSHDSSSSYDSGGSCSND